MYANPCFSMPCFNSGKCHVKNNNKFQCECQPGYHGTYCEADLRRCTSSPCAKGCQCIEIPLNMTYECKCKSQISKSMDYKQYQTHPPIKTKREPQLTFFYPPFLNSKLTL